MPDDALTATSKVLVREREENYFRDRPAFNCQPSGPEPMLGWRRIIQMPSLIAIAYENLTYHLIFMDGRKLEANPERTWMGYSVGRWEGTRWWLTVLDSTIAHGWTVAACPIRTHSGPRNVTCGAISDSCRSNSP